MRLAGIGGHTSLPMVVRLGSDAMVSTLIPGGSARTISGSDDGHIDRDPPDITESDLVERSTRTVRLPPSHWSGRAVIDPSTLRRQGRCPGARCGHRAASTAAPLKAVGAVLDVSLPPATSRVVLVSPGATERTTTHALHNRSRRIGGGAALLATKE
ncbi:MAG: hypothetical protein WCG96_05080 [Actinomycetes bacterium]